MLKTLLTVLCFISSKGASAQVSVSVSSDVVVQHNGPPTDVWFSCRGSSPDISFYIKHKIKWDFIDTNNTIHGLTFGFFKKDGNGFSNKEFIFRLVKEAITGCYIFSIKLPAITMADEGIYRCSLLDDDNNVIDSEDASLTVI